MTTTDIINARKGRKIRNTDKVTCITEISDILRECCLIKGQRKESEELTLMAGIVYDRLMQLYAGLTLEEVKMACHEGTYTGNFKSISPEAVFISVNSYKQSDVYRVARWEEDTVDPAYRIENKSQKTKEQEIEDAARFCLRRDFEDYSRDGEFSKHVRPTYPRSRFSYPYLVERGAIGADDWKNFLEEGGRAMRKAEVEKEISLIGPLEEGLTVEDYAKKMCLERYIQAKVENKRRMTFEEVGDLPE